MSDFAIQVDKLITGACDIAYAPTTVAVPTNIADIITLTGASPTVQTGWSLLGATEGGASYSREVESDEISVDQRQGAVFEDITNITRTFTTRIAEITPAHLQILEEAPAISTIAAATGKSVQRLVKAGSFDEFTRYRVAFIAQRRKSQGLVTDPGGGNPRGCYVVGVLYNAALAADTSELTFEEGGLATATVTFKAFAESTLSVGADTIGWFEEQAGAIT